MKRPHRRVHLLFWAIALPGVLAIAIYALSLRPSAPLLNQLPLEQQQQQEKE